tara:strand:- start:277 stop:1392 length:1116 start_codon:yes stop_codon:yes gene_type:complete
MIITQVEPIPIHVPLKQGLTTKTAHGEHITSPYVVVKVYTDEDLVGLGEATLSPRWSGETSRGCVAVIEDILSPALEGHDPTNISAAREIISGAIKLNPFTKAAVEMALWDIKGKALNVPVYQLLGGKVRDEIPIKMVVGAFDLEKATALAKRFLDWGVKCLKVKVGLNPKEDIERIAAVRDLAGPEIPIGFDANCGWDLPTARKMLKELEPFNILFAEQPIPPHDPNDLAQLRRESNIPIMADESVFTLNDARQLTRIGAADILSIYPGKSGGLLEAVETAHLAHAAGIVCSMGSNLELGIGTAAMLHLAAAETAIDSETYPADLIGPLYHEADMITEPLELGPDTAKVPDAPGLGVELDEKQIERWRGH